MTKTTRSKLRDSEHVKESRAISRGFFVNGYELVSSQNQGLHSAGVLWLHGGYCALR